MSKINILIDGHVFDGEYQGSRTYVKEIYLALLKKHSAMCQLFIACSNTKVVEKEFEEVIANVTILKTNIKNRLICLNFEIPYLIIKHNIQFAHFQYVIPILKPCKYIVTTHDILFNDFKEYFTSTYRVLRNIFFKFSCLLSDYVLTVSEYSKKAIHHYYKIPLDKIYITPNGVSKEYFNNYDKAKAIKLVLEKYKIKNYILYVSRFEPRKNHLLLLKSFNSLKLYEQGLQLLFVGKVSISSLEYQKYYNKMSVDAQKHVLHLENVPPKDLLNIYNAATLFVYPSLAEGFGIPPLEAAACRIPVICAKNTAMQDFYFFHDNLVDIESVYNFENSLLNSLQGNLCYDINEATNIIKEKYNWVASSNVLFNIIST